MPEAKYVRWIAERCRRLAKASFDFELSAELKEIADDLTAKAEEWEQVATQPPPGILKTEASGGAGVAEGRRCGLSLVYLRIVTDTSFTSEPWGTIKTD
jgi:hypothetical protein